MFRTYDVAKVHLPWSKTGVNAWTYAGLFLNRSWFFADCKITDGVESTNSTYLLSKSNQIYDLISNPNISIEALYLVSPPYINDKESWSMDQLNRVCCGQATQGDQDAEVEIYELLNGNKYYSSSYFKDSGSIKDIKVIIELGI